MNILENQVVIFYISKKVQKMLVLCIVLWYNNYGIQIILCRLCSGRMESTMNSAYVYLQIYRMFDNCTPLSVDCGELCSHACCSGDDAGMFLFPGEEKVYELLKPEGFRMEISDFTYDDNGKIRKTPILFCDGRCDRYIRPLACRIFPITPILDKDGNIEIITDPRARRLCPLAKTFSVEEYESRFVRTVRKAFLLLSKNKHCLSFLRQYTEYINEFNKFFS